MATIVESPGIVSAKEEAAAILFAREPQSTPVMTAPAPEQKVHVHEQLVRPTFARYREPETIPVRPKVLDTTVLRPYENYEEMTTTTVPQIVRPGIDSSEYAPAVASTSITLEAPEMATVETTQKVSQVESPLDLQLEEDTQYVVKFKNSTIVALTIVATIFLLMTVLFVVNVVNLVTMSAEVNALVQETTTLEQSLTQGQTELEQIRAEANANSTATPHQVHYVAKVESDYAEPANVTVNSSFFDWLCHSLSRLFN